MTLLLLAVAATLGLLLLAGSASSDEEDSPVRAAEDENPSGADSLRARTEAPSAQPCDAGIWNT
jgi:hypothetical protein